MKKHLLVLSSTVLAVTMLSACSSGTSEPTNSSPSESASTQSSETENSDFDFPVSQELDPESLEIIRNSFNEADREIKEKGGVSFDLIDASANITTSFDIGYDGSGYQQSIIEGSDPEEFYWSTDTLYTPVKFIDPEVKEYVLKVDDKAEWFSEPKSTQFSLITPTRIAEAFLAYAQQVTCNEAAANTECIVIATGINYLPGLGGFDPPRDEIRMNLTIDNATGNLQNIVLFPGAEGLERILANIEYQAPNITYPTENSIVTFDETTEQILLDNPIEEETDTSTVPSDEPTTEETDSNQ